MTIGNFNIQFNTSALTNPKLRHKPIDEVPYWKMYQVHVTPDGKMRTPIGTGTFQEWKEHFEAISAHGSTQPSKTYFEAYPRLTNNPIKILPCNNIVTEEHLRKIEAKAAKQLEALK